MLSMFVIPVYLFYQLIYLFYQLYKGYPVFFTHSSLFLSFDDRKNNNNDNNNIRTSWKNQNFGPQMNLCFYKL